jgi:hypothetical protein
VVTQLVLTKRYHPLTRAFLAAAATFDTTGARACYPALGPVEDVRATGDSRRWIELTCTHRGGAVSQLSLSGAVGLPSSRAGINLFGPAGELGLDFGPVDHRECWPVLRSEFAAAVRSGVPHDLDVRRGLMLQELLARADPA